MSASRPRAMRCSADTVALPDEARRLHDRHVPLMQGEPASVEVLMGAPAPRLVPDNQLWLGFTNTKRPLAAPVDAHPCPPRIISEDQIYLGIRASRFDWPVLEEMA